MATLEAAKPLNVFFVPFGTKFHRHHGHYHLAVVTNIGLGCLGLHTHGFVVHDSIGHALGLFQLQRNGRTALLLIYPAFTVEVYKKSLRAVCVVSQICGHHGFFAGSFRIFNGQGITGHNKGTCN